MKLPELKKTNFSGWQFRLIRRARSREAKPRSAKSVNRTHEPTGRLDDFLSQATKRNGKLLPLDLSRLSNVNLKQMF
ncbi:MAG: hypothetical protein N3B10_05830 [Armatimonadetes bacterium]|nr:hypothetical protein [Armatimonadota bacterium]MCX7967997.1 hypothetical protein [Armatimonadota bacterium]MDW8142044.1 hypothetical protein [Armatimonadota bacterium]